VTSITLNVRKKNITCVPEYPAKVFEPLRIKKRNKKKNINRRIFPTKKTDSESLWERTITNEFLLIIHQIFKYFLAPR
jgi:hypothetical protein